MFSAGIAALLALLFPNRCIGCRVRGSDLCALCRADLPWLGEAACPRCGAFVPMNARCRQCLRTRLSLDGVRVAFRYEGAARTAIHDLKYRRIRERADLLGGFLADAVERRPLALDVLAPVPLTPVTEAPVTPVVSMAKDAITTPVTASLKVTVKSTEAALVGLAPTRVMLLTVGAALSTV